MPSKHISALILLCVFTVYVDGTLGCSCISKIIVNYKEPFKI